MTSRIIIGMSGASGAIYAIRLLEMLRTLQVSTHLIMSKSAELTVAYETDWKIADVKGLADSWYAIDDIGAAPASGSFRTMGMIIAPCSVRTVAELATGVTGNLLTRAADVVLKEQHKLVLMVRETPLHLVHLRNLSTLSELGAIIAPPVPAFYARPKSIDDMIDHTLGRVLDSFDYPGSRVRL
jgi:4-hydroxy-3-polyprenylbenzoate decarboxylase